MVSGDVMLARVMEENRQLRETVLFLNSKIDALQQEIARLKKNSRNSSKPPSSDIVKPNRNGTSQAKHGRKIGGQQGHPRQERAAFAPEDVDRVIPYELSPAQRRGLIPLKQWFVRQQVDLADKLYIVTEYRARKYLDP